MSFLFPPAVQPALPIDGEDALFPVGRIFCVGRNYDEHVREMGGDPTKGSPIFFDKPASALVMSGEALSFPLATSDLHHEIELAVALQRGGSKLSAEEASQCIYGYAVALDMTRRDLQAEAKKGGKPWDMAKGFDESAPCGPITPMPGQVLAQGAITLSVNGDERQAGDLAEMIWRVDEIIMSLSCLVTLRQGDVILTGTPAGVGPVHPGDELVGKIAGLNPLHISYNAKQSAQ